VHAALGWVGRRIPVMSYIPACGLPSRASSANLGEDEGLVSALNWLFIGDLLPAGRIPPNCWAATRRGCAWAPFRRRQPRLLEMG
jgi:hypothetical protein